MDFSLHSEAMTAPWHEVLVWLAGNLDRLTALGNTFARLRARALGGMKKLVHCDSDWTPCPRTREPRDFGTRSQQCNFRPQNSFWKLPFEGSWMQAHSISVECTQLKLFQADKSLATNELTNSLAFSSSDRGTVCVDSDSPGIPLSISSKGPASSSIVTSWLDLGLAPKGARW